MERVLRRASGVKNENIKNDALQEKGEGLSSGQNAMNRRIHQGSGSRQRRKSWEAPQPEKIRKKGQELPRLGKDSQKNLPKLTETS